MKWINDDALRSTLSSSNVVNVEDVSVGLSVSAKYPPLGCFTRFKLPASVVIEGCSVVMPFNLYCGSVIDIVFLLSFAVVGYL